MPRPTMDVNGAEYQEILKQRELYRLYKSDYPDVKWADEVIGRLEKKQPYDDYTDKDHADFRKAREIVDRITIKYGSGDCKRQEARTTTHYIWRTRQDDKVRPEHAANEGKIFAWDNPPPTGHPGEDYGCRCRAEPFNIEDEESRIEFRNQVVAIFQPDLGEPWTTFDYTQHYRHGGGVPVTLHETGQLQNVIIYASTYSQPEGGSIFNRFARDIFKEARQRGAGSFTKDFEGNYNMISIVTSFRTVSVGGTASVSVEDRGKFLIIHADIEYEFKDRYTDPGDWSDHSKDPRGSDVIRDDFGIPYDITDAWSTTLTAMIRRDSSQSKYPDDEFGSKK